MILAFTGTRRGMTPEQHAALPSVLACLPELVLHGGAKGADAQFHAFLALKYAALGQRPMPIEVYPGETVRWTHWNYSSQSGELFKVHKSAPPLDRDKAIARRCDHLLACPDGPERARSGTWATVRYARAAGKPVTIVMPDGTVQEERR